MFAICLTILALGFGMSDAGQVRRPAAIPQLIPLSNFTEVVEEAVSFLTTSGRQNIDLEPCVVGPAYLRLWGEEMTLALENFRVFGVTNFVVQDLRQIPGDSENVHFTLSLPRMDIRGKAEFVKPTEGGQFIVSAKETQTQFKFRARVLGIKGRPQITFISVERSQVPSQLQTWLSAPLDPLDRQIIDDLLRKVADPCVSSLSERLSEVVNDLLLGRTIVSNHKVSEKVARIVAKRLTPSVPLTPFKINRPIRCIVNNHKILLRRVEIDSLQNCTFVQPAKDRELLHLVAQCDPIQFSANLTITDPKRASESLDFTATVGVSTFVKLHLVEQPTRRRRVRIAKIFAGQASVFRYDTKAVSPANVKGSMAAECIKRFIFIDGKQIMRKVLRFDRQ